MISASLRRHPDDPAAAAPSPAMMASNVQCQRRIVPCLSTSATASSISRAVVPLHAPATWPWQLVEHLHAELAAARRGSRARLVAASRPSVAHRRGCWCRRTRSPFVGPVPIEFVIGRKRPVAPGHPRERPAALVFPGLDLNGSAPCGDHVQFVAFPSPSASTSALGNRTARLLPHFETCIAGLYDIHSSIVYHSGYILIVQD